MITILLVEDSPVAVTVLKRMIGETSDLAVVGTARTGVEAMELIPKLRPQVICTDLHMPKMDGLELTRQIMAQYPTPILVISASVQAEDTKEVFQLLNAGAVDVFPKPPAGLANDYETVKTKLTEKIRVLSGVKVFTKTGHLPSPRPSKQYSPLVPSSYPPPAFKPDLSATIKVIALGASTGGPQALQEVLSVFPLHLPVPILCVQHISQGFLQGFVDWLDANCPIPVQIAQHKEMPKPGVVYLPPDKEHLEIDAGGRFLCSKTASVDGHCPSVTVLFNSVAKYYGRHSIAALLSGMGRDGASGLLAIARHGSYTIAQNEESCVVFGMPQEAIKLGAAHQILPLTEIGPRILARFWGDKEVK